MAVLEDLLGSGKQGDGVVIFTKNFTKNLFQSIQGDPRQVLLVKAFVGKVKLFPKGFPVKEGFSMKSKDVVGGGEYGCEVIDQGSRPIKDEIAYQWEKKPR